MFSGLYGFEMVVENPFSADDVPFDSGDGAIASIAPVNLDIGEIGKELVLKR